MQAKRELAAGKAKADEEETSGPSDLLAAEEDEDVIF